MASKVKRHPSIEPAHPGELLNDVIIPAVGRKKSDIADLLGVSRQTLYNILSCKQPVTPEMAVRLGKMFGDGGEVWLRTQAAYDTWHAERTIDLSKIPTLLPTDVAA